MLERLVLPPWLRFSLAPPLLVLGVGFRAGYGFAQLPGPLVCRLALFLTRAGAGDDPELVV